MKKCSASPLLSENNSDLINLIDSNPSIMKLKQNGIQVEGFLKCIHGLIREGKIDGIVIYGNVTKAAPVYKIDVYIALKRDVPYSLDGKYFKTGQGHSQRIILSGEKGIRKVIRDSMNKDKRVRYNILHESGFDASACHFFDQDSLVFVSGNEEILGQLKAINKKLKGLEDLFEKYKKCKISKELTHIFVWQENGWAHAQDISTTLPQGERTLSLPTDSQNSSWGASIVSSPIFIGAQQSPWLDRIEDSYEIVKASGLNVFEVLLRSRPYRLTSYQLFKEWRLRFGSMAKQDGMILQIHGNMDDITRGKEEFLLFIDNVWLAYETSSRVLTTHLHRPGKKFAQALMSLIDFAADKNAKLAIENTYFMEGDRQIWHAAKHINDTFSYLDKYCRKIAGICFDAGHALNNDEGPIEFLRNLDPAISIYNVHLHGSRIEENGDEIHTSILNDSGTKHIMAQTFRELLRQNYQGAFVLEYWDTADNLKRYSEFLRQMEISSSPLWRGKNMAAASPMAQFAALPIFLLKGKLSEDLKEFFCAEISMANQGTQSSPGKNSMVRDGQDAAHSFFFHDDMWSVASNNPAVSSECFNCLLARYIGGEFGHLDRDFIEKLFFMFGFFSFGTPIQYFKASNKSIFYIFLNLFQSFALTDTTGNSRTFGNIPAVLLALNNNFILHFIISPLNKGYYIFILKSRISLSRSTSLMILSFSPFAHFNNRPTGNRLTNTAASRLSNSPVSSEGPMVLSKGTSFRLSLRTSLEPNNGAASRLSNSPVRDEGQGTHVPTVPIGSETVSSSIGTGVADSPLRNRGSDAARESRGLPIVDLEKYAIKIKTKSVDFSSVPSSANWLMREIRPQESGPIYSFDAIREVKLSYPAIYFPTLSTQGKNNMGIYLGLAQIDELEQPVVIKLLRIPSINFEREFIKAQVLDRLGVGPRFYGAVTNKNKAIVGYAMQVGWLGTSAFFEDSMLTNNDYREIKRRTAEVGLSIPSQYLVTPEGRLIVIDAGDVSTIDHGKLKDFVLKGW